MKLLFSIIKIKLYTIFMQTKSCSFIKIVIPYEEFIYESRRLLSKDVAFLQY